jgi:hypothetical protein
MTIGLLVCWQFGYTCYMAIFDVLAIFLNGYMVCRLFGQFGYIVIWPMGYLVIWLYYYVVSRLYCYMAHGIFGYTIIWPMGFWLFGYLLHGLLVVCIF